MNRLYCIAATLAIGMTASTAFAQGTPAGAAAAPAAGAAAPATTTTAPAATTTTDDKSADDKAKKKSASTGTKKSNKSELDRSVDSKTVPSRYKSQIPREYHGYIPWGR